MDALKLLPVVVLSLVVAGVMLGTSVITMNAFGDTIDEPCFNGSFSLNETHTQFCTNNTPVTVIAGCCGEEGLNTTAEYYAVVKSTEGISTLSNQTPTLGIIAAMVLIITMLGGIFVYFRMR